MLKWIASLATVTIALTAKEPGGPRRGPTRIPDVVDEQHHPVTDRFRDVGRHLERPHDVRQLVGAVVQLLLRAAKKA